MKQIRVSASAGADLEEIWLYIAQDNVDAADKLIHSVVSRFPRLATIPELGRRREELSTGLRTNSFQKGAVYSKTLTRKTHGWFYETKLLLKSKDTRRHIDLILNALELKAEAVQMLHQRGCKISIVSYFVCCGQGGPALWPGQMLKLGKLGIEIWWDVYFGDENEDVAMQRP